MKSSSAKQVVFFFLLLLALHPCKNSGSAARVPVPKTHTEFIKTSCTATDYPKLCITSLSSFANKIQKSPELLAVSALDVALLSTVSTSSMVEKLLKGQGLNPKDAGAMKDCVEELSDSMDELKSSIGEMGKLRGFNFQLAMNNIQTWISAALTDQNACTDGFEEDSMDDNIIEDVRQHILNIAHLTSNALALVNRFADIRG